jgi:hypothetical protein
VKLAAQVATLTVGTLAAVGVVYLPDNTETVPPVETFVPFDEVFATTTTSTVWTPNPIAPDLSADTHDTESLTAPVPAIPDGLTYEPVTTTTLVPPSALCGMWWVTATAVGWDTDDLPTLDRVLYNESRCISGLESSTGDVGLAQLNVATWAHLWETDGHTTDDVATNPALNLLYARKVADAAEAIGWCEWEPWHGFSGDYC